MPCQVSICPVPIYSVPTCPDPTYTVPSCPDPTYSVPTHSCPVIRTNFHCQTPIYQPNCLLLTFTLFLGANFTSSPFPVSNCTSNFLFLHLPLVRFPFFRCPIVQFPLFLFPFVRSLFVQCPVVR